MTGHALDRLRGPAARPTAWNRPSRYGATCGFPAWPPVRRPLHGKGRKATRARLTLRPTPGRTL